MTNSKKRNKKKRKKNILGLTPKGEEREDSDEDIDEEAQAQAKMTATGDLNSSEGPVVNFRSRDDILNWIAERKRNYPTEARRIARASLATFGGACKGKKEEPEKVDMALKLGLQGYSSDSDSDGKTENGSKLEAVKSEDGINIKPDTTESAFTIKAKTTSTRGGGDNESVSSEEPSSESSVSSDSDAPPQEESSRRKGPGEASAPLNLEESSRRSKKKKAVSGEDPNLQPYCRNWNTYGKCTWKNCKFRHERPGVTDSAVNERFAQHQQRTHRKTLYQKWVEAELMEQKNQALQFVKYLGKEGFLDEPTDEDVV
jgi:Nuclear fragile X mental retardation-interacting protein 1 (NUFIP1)